MIIYNTHNNTVNPVYRGHRREPENVPLWAGLLYVQAQIIYIYIYLMEKIKLLFIDSV
jgi:hypothetical protein